MDEIVREFLIECNELLDNVDRALVGLEKDPGSKELLNQIFRAVHTIKGTSGTLGYPHIEQLSHSGENLFSLLRNGTIALTEEMTSALLAAMDLLRRMIGNIEASGGEGDEDITGAACALSRFLPGAIGKAGAGKEVPFVGSGVVEASALELNAAASERVAAARYAAIGADAGSGPSELNAGTTVPNANLNVSNSTIRVDVHLLDKLMDLVGELVLSRNQLLQMTTRISDGQFGRTVLRLKTLTSELQEGITKTRMQPIENVWKKLPRLVRDISASCKKQVRIQMQGSETELDKTLLEAINDPLMHVIRNSIDHGIEAPEERPGLGKPEEGLISLRAFHEGGQVNVEISDDGRGVQIERVKQQALNDGTITASRAATMSDQEALNLIFLPGLSTAKQVTNVSGRGVGMDVVKTNIESIGGTVDLTSECGRGTKLTIKIPLTLAIIPALIVASGKERFAIPQVSLLELVRLEEDAAHRQIERIHGQPVFRLRGKLLPLVELNRELKLERFSPDGSCSIVVLQADGRHFGLLVDEIYDTEEIVVKPLSNQIKSIRCFSGATILGDGHVALILDVWGLAKQAGFETRENEQKGSLGEAIKQGAKTAGNSWLLFRISDTGRMALPLSSVSRLEKLDIKRVEHSGESEVFQYRGQVMPLIDIAKFLGRQSLRMAPDVLEVVVYPHKGRNVGLVVDEILDIVQGQSLLEERHSERGIAGCAVIQDRVTDLLDVGAALKSLDFIREGVHGGCA